MLLLCLRSKFDQSKYFVVVVDLLGILCLSSQKDQQKCKSASIKHLLNEKTRHTQVPARSLNIQSQLYNLLVVAGFGKREGY